MNKVLSIEITDLVTRVCEMSYNKKVPKVFKSIIFDNPKGSVEDGFIKDPDKYGQALTKGLKSAKMKTTNAIFVFSSNKTVSREITVPDMKVDKIDGLIENERATYFPMDTSNHKFTFYVLEKLKKTNQLRIMIYAVPTELIGNYKILAHNIGLKVIKLDCSGNTISNWLVRPECKEMGLYLEINEKNTVFTITDKNMMALQRNMNFGTLSLNMDKPITAPMIRPLTTNIASVLEYYNTKNRDADVSKIYVGGAGNQIPNLKELMEQEFIGIEIEIVKKLPGVIVPKKNQVMRKHSTEFIGCLGVTDSSIDFNYGDEQKRANRALVRCILAAILVTTASGLIIMNGVYEYQDAIARRSKLKHELEELQKIKIEELEYEYIASDGAADEVAKMHKSTETINEHWNDIIAALEEDSVTSMVLNSITSDQTGIALSISVASKADAAKMIMQLQDMVYPDGRKIFSSVKTSGITDGTGNDEELTGGSAVNISIQCAYSGVELPTSSGTNNMLLNTVKDGINGITEELSNEMTELIKDQLNNSIPIDIFGANEKDTTTEASAN